MARQHLLEIGYSVIDGEYSGEEAKDKIKDVVKDGLYGVDTEKLLVRCALLLATANWCQKEIPRSIRNELEYQLGYEVPLIGGSLTGLYCSHHPTPYIDNGIILVLFCSNDLFVTVDHLNNPHDLSAEERKKQLEELAARLEKKSDVRLGTSARKSLFGFLPGIFTDETGKRRYFDNELHREILVAFGYRYQLYGAAASNGIKPTTGFQFANDELLESGVALAIIETDLSTGAAMTHGFEPIPVETGVGKLRVSVDEIADGQPEGYEVTKLDGKPVAQRLKELRDEGALKFSRPLFGLPEGSDFRIFWPLAMPERNEGKLLLKRRVSVGDRLYLLTSTPQKMGNAGVAAMRLAAERATGEQKEEILLFLWFSCTNRIKQYFKTDFDWKKTLNDVREDYTGVPVIGGTCAGEFGVDHLNGSRSNNMSFNLMCVSNISSRHSRARSLSKKLLEAASSLLKCQTPAEIMKVALEGVLEAGATGGLICLADKKLRRILGSQGQAIQKPDSERNWIREKDLTDYFLSEESGGEFPSNLREWAMPVIMPNPYTIQYVSGNDGGKRENVLTLVARTLYAIFFPDSKGVKSHGSIKAGVTGSGGCQLVVPLMGVNYGVVATLQIGFKSGTLLDQESFTLWVSYSQKVGAALERALEAEEKTALEKISLFADKVFQSKVTADSSPYEWCNEFLDILAKSIRADGSNIRIYSPKSNKAELVAEYGVLAYLLKKTRPAIEEGSYKNERLHKNNLVLNSKGEVDEFLKAEEVKALDQVEEFGEAFKKEVNELQSLAILSLRDQEKIIGTFDVYSKKPNFYTERVEFIVRAAAKLASDILRAKKTEIDKARLDVEKEWTLKSLGLLTRENAQQRLSDLLKRVCERIGADVGALYVWHPEPEELLLHTSYNWYKNSDWCARYKIGERWTGRLADQKSDEIKLVLRKNEDKELIRRRSKYYDQMIERSRQITNDETYCQAGVRLEVLGRLVGVVVCLYDKDNQHLYQHYKRTKDFLAGIKDLIAIAVDTTNREVARKKREAIFEVKTDIDALLIESGEAPEVWQKIFDVIRKGFRVERVSFYKIVPKKRLDLIYTSLDENSNLMQKSISSSEPKGALGELISGKEPLMIFNPDDSRLKSWNTERHIKNLLAVPVVNTKGEVRGVMEFTNRLDAEVPKFGLFDDLEVSMALSISTTIAAAIEHNEQVNRLEILTGKLATATKIGMAGVLGAIVMHQLMTPFAKIGIATEWLKRYPDSSPEDKKTRLDNIDLYCSQAVEIVRAAAANPDSSVKHRVAMQTIIDNALRFIKPGLQQARIKIEVNKEQQAVVKVALWPVVGAVVNVLSNAVDAMQGSGKITVSLEVAAETKRAVIRIHNTGTRLTEAEIKHVFQPGFSTKKGKDHLGLGLSLTKQAIEEEGGSIIIESPPDGVEVIISLPIAEN